MYKPIDSDCTVCPVLLAEPAEFFGIHLNDDVAQLVRGLLATLLSAELLLIRIY